MPCATLLRAVLMRLLLAGGSTLPNIVPFPKRYTPVQDGIALRLAQDFEVTKADDSADPEDILELAVSRYTKLLKLTPNKHSPAHSKSDLRLQTPSDYRGPRKLLQAQQETHQVRNRSPNIEEVDSPPPRVHADRGYIHQGQHPTVARSHPYEPRRLHRAHPPHAEVHVATPAVEKKDSFLDPASLPPENTQLPPPPLLEQHTQVSDQESSSSNDHALPSGADMSTQPLDGPSADAEASGAPGISTNNNATAEALSPPDPRVGESPVEQRLLPPDGTSPSARASETPPASPVPSVPSPGVPNSQPPSWSSSQDSTKLHEEHHTTDQPALASKDTEHVSQDKGSEVASSGDTPDNAAGAGTGQTVEDMQVVTTLEIRVVEDSLRLGLGMDESYTLEVKAPVATVVAPSTWGALRALETFSQMINRSSGESFVPSAIVEDAPRYSHRGIMIDSSKHFLPVAAILQILDAMEYSKLNVLHWRLADHESFPFVSSVFPKLSELGAYDANHTYPPEDVQRVILHARQRGIRVVAELDSPGHTASWGKGYPELMTPCGAGGRLMDGPLDPSKPSTFDFLDTLWGELAQTFPDQFMHLGGDKIDLECWRRDRLITEFRHQQHIPTVEKLHEIYEAKMINMTHKYAKEAIVWQDLFDGRMNLDKETVIHVRNNDIWRQSLDRITQAGYKVLLSGGWNWNGVDNGDHWKDFYAQEPTSFGGSYEQHNLIVGGEACMWGELVDATNIIPLLWPRVAAVAERLWSPQHQNKLDEAERRFVAWRCHLVERGINAEPILHGNYCPTEYSSLYRPTRKL